MSQRLLAWRERANAALRGAPDEVLTVSLLGVAAVCVVVALTGDSLAKAAVLAWTVFP